MNRRSSFFLFGPFLLALACSPPPEPADLVLHNGHVITADDNAPRAQGVAVRAGRIVAVGTEEEIKSYIGPDTRDIDLEGKTAIPGLIEGHGHFVGIGDAQQMLHLSQPKNWDEIVALVAEAVGQTEPGQWIYGRGWHQDKWNPPPQPSYEGLPLHDALSAVSPDNPVVLTHASGHAAIVNAKALELAGIDRKTPDPDGGEILRDSRGRATGFLRETAQGLVGRAADRRTPAEEEARVRKSAQLAAEECLSKGITSFHDAGSSFRTIDVFKKLDQEGRLPVRLYVMIRASNDDLRANLASYRTIASGDSHLTVRAIKVSIDGALGSRGAWLLEPYSDAPELSGLNLVPLDAVRETARLAAEHDYQLCIHAIGDRGNREVLDIYQATFHAHPGKSDWRWRVEHAQHLHPDDLPRFASLDVIASMQAVHATSDGPWVPDRLGLKRSREGAYMWRSLIDSGATVINGTDAPVEDVDPLAGYYSSVSRMMVNGQRFFPDQSMTREEALKSYTINAAYAAFEEDVKGSLTPGKVGDIVVLSQDILSVPEQDLPKTQVLYTIVGGQILYQKQ